MRDEAEIFEELKQLCSSDGYIHVMAFLCFSNNVIPCADELLISDMLLQYSTNCLLRTEQSVLIRLMFKTKISLNVPEIKRFNDMLNKTENLLAELHQAISIPFHSFCLQNIQKATKPDFLTQGKFLREAFFYNGESAYPFQYREFAEKKFVNDNPWLLSNKGFNIEDAKAVILCIQDIQEKRAIEHLKSLQTRDRNDLTMLPAFIFSGTEIAKKLNFKKNLVDNIISSFMPPEI